MKKIYLLLLFIFAVQIAALSQSTEEEYIKSAIEKTQFSDMEGACEDWQKALDLGMKEAEGFISKYCK
jgi:hypothetical protein